MFKIYLVIDWETQSMHFWKVQQMKNSLIV